MANDTVQKIVECEKECQLKIKAENQAKEKRFGEEKKRLEKEEADFVYALNEKKQKELEIAKSEAAKLVAKKLEEAEKEGKILKSLPVQQLDMNKTVFDILMKN